MIFEDIRLQCFVAEYENIEHAIIHIGSEMWIEICLIDNAYMPLNTAYENVFYLNMKDLYYSKNMKIFKDLLGEKLHVVEGDLDVSEI